MWIVDLKIVLGFCIYTALAYHGSKQDYIKWRERLLPKRPATTTESAVTSANDIYYQSLKLRHHSRFPNSDRVMTRVDNNFEISRRKNDVQTMHNRVRHQSIYRQTSTTTPPDDELFGDDGGDSSYDEEYANDDVNEYDDWEDENDDQNNNFEEYEDDTTSNDDPFADEENEWQAEQATEPQPFSATVSSLTKYKWDNYGTRSKVEESRRQHLKLSNEGRATSAVIEHYMKIKQEGQCLRPQPKVVSVQSEHPNPSKTYTPHCTILHRCAEDTGCCTNFETKCGPKTQVAVHLYFYVRTLGVAGTKVEKLMFYNHTECACVDKSKQPASVASTDESAPIRSLSMPLASRPENIRQCKCPEEFSPKYRYNAGCNCDCDDHNQDCIRMKKGKEFFSLTDRKCIIENKCGIPVCEYGVYMRQIGRCQRKQEKFETFSRMTVD